MLDLDPLYLFYACAAIAAVLAAEAFYLAFHNTKDYRNRVNRRLDRIEREGSLAASHEKHLLADSGARGIRRDQRPAHRLPCRVEGLQHQQLQAGERRVLARRHDVADDESHLHD